MQWHPGSLPGLPIREDRFVVPVKGEGRYLKYPHLHRPLKAKTKHRIFDNHPQLVTVRPPEQSITIHGCAETHQTLELPALVVFTDIGNAERLHRAELLPRATELKPPALLLLEDVKSTT